MRDDLKDHGRFDRSWADDDESWEVRWIAQELGVAEDELKSATRAARLIVTPVKQHLGRD